MSELRVDNIVSEDGTAAPIYSKGMTIGAGQTLTCAGDFSVSGDVTFSQGANVAGVVTFSDGVDIVSNGTVLSGIVTASTFASGGLDVGGVNATGIVTAALFTGSLGGASATSLSVSGVSTFTGNVDANGDLDVDGHTELDNVRITGVLTATSAEFSGNVTIGGDLTYENVSNVDSVGIATARSGLRITGGGLDVVGVSTFNNDANLTSGNSYLIDGTEVLSATILGTGVTESSLRSVSSQLISDRVELSGGQPEPGDYILVYDNTDSVLKKATIQNAALQGVQGTQGIQGIQGVQGTYGTQGIQGIQGVEAPTTFTIDSKTSAYTLVAGDSGKLISITTGGVTVPNAVFSGGSSVMIYNNSSSNQNIVQGSGLTLRLPGTGDSGTRVIQQRGLVTVFFLSGGEALISGTGLL